MMVTTTTVQREMIHWLWLWTLATIAVSVMQGVLLGQSPDQTTRPGQPPAIPQPYDDTDAGRPIPMPNVDHPDWFRYPNQSPLPERDAASLQELLQLHRVGDFQQALKGWQEIRPLAGSETWKQVGIGVALLQLNQLDEAMAHLEESVRQDPTNAVAEYFMGKARQAQGRQIPFWYESDQDMPFRLASVVSSTGSLRMESQNRPRPKMLLPHYIDDAYDRLARQHFRRALALAPQCDLNRVIQVASEEPPVIQLASQRTVHDAAVTVGDLLESLGERDYVRKAQAELGMHRAFNPLEDNATLEDDAAASTVPDGRWIAID